MSYEVLSGYLQPMSTLLSARQVLNAVMPTLQSVDVRCFTLAIEGADYNVLTTVAFSELPTETIRASNEALANSHAGFGDNRFQFRSKVLPCERWLEVIAEFESGFLRFDGCSANLMRPVDVLGSQGYIGSMSFLHTRSDWPVFESHLGSNEHPNDPASPAYKLRMLQHDQDLLRHLNANGYRHLKDVFKTFVKSRTDSEPWSASDVYISVPIFAAIRRLKYIPNEHRLTVAFDCNVALWPKTRIFGERVVTAQDTERIALSQPEQVSDDSWIASATLEIAEGSPDIVLSLSHGDLGYVATRSAAPRELLPPEEFNPLWHLLQAFCPSSTIETLLTAPPKPDDQRPKEQRLFEQHIAWLLAVHGFSVIVLGKYEDLKTPESPIQLGSLDILAYHERRKKVLLCSCTLTPPEERDYGNLVSVRSLLLSRIDQNVSFQTELAIFSAAAECVPPPHYTNQETYVPIFDGRDLKGLIEDLNAGRDERLFGKLEGAGLHGDRFAAY